MREHFYSPDGERIDHAEWQRLWLKRSESTNEDETWWRKRTQIDAQVDVSTVWAGIDYSFGHGPPLIWEAMIFGGDYDGYQWRYPTKEAALAHHEWLVTALHQGLDPESELKAVL